MEPFLLFFSFIFFYFFCGIGFSLALKQLNAKISYTLFNFRVVQFLFWPMILIYLVSLNLNLPPLESNINQKQSEVAPLSIYKYQLSNKIEMPKGSSILTVQNQNGKPQFWVLVNPKQPLETRHFLITVTGSHLEHKPDDLNYIGTFQTSDGELVNHVFEKLTVDEISQVD